MSRLPDPPAIEYDVSKIRRDFPILRQEVYDMPLVYLDNAATAQKPNAVINAVDHYYSSDNANIHRGVHALSMRSTEAFEGVREKVRSLLNAKDASEIVFVRGATEAVNLVANSYGRKNVKEGDEVIITTLEHHSNIVPWQLLCEMAGATLRVVPIDQEGNLILEEYEKLFTSKTKIVGITHISNAVGTLNPVKDMIATAHSHGVPVLIDGAQAVPHLAIDVQDLDADFYVFSAHKMFAPNGVGALYGKRELLDAMPPYQGGGDMIESVTFEKTTYNIVPHKFEAGTPNIAGTIGMGAAIDWFMALDHEGLAAHEADLLAYGTERLLEVPGLRIIGTAPDKAAVISFVLDYAHPHDVGTILDQQGVAVRTGHHCAQPVMDHFDVAATVRASFGAYSNRDDIDALVEALGEVRELFG
jgi:cysteine desulfurase/selenocysteine lyase